jgi:hypothetical protein
MPIHTTPRRLAMKACVGFALTLSCALLACVYGGFTVSATRLTVVKKNDVPRGDEPYLASIRFRSTYGDTGSTHVEVEDSLKTLGSQVRPGHSVSLPSEIGVKTFGTIAALDEADIAEGRSPGMGGVLYVMMEEDHAGKDQVRKTVRARAETLRELLVENVEKVKWSKLALPLSLNAINDGLKKEGGGEACGLMGKPFCGLIARIGDDFIASNGVIYVSITQPYFETLEAGWKRAAAVFHQEWPGCGSLDTPVCPVQSESHLLEFHGKDAFYQLEVEAEFVPSN